jgi:hypothetical protein
MKLEAKDLRIGNLVMDNAKVKIVTSGMISNWDIIKRDYGGYKPIPLTEEWLVRFGFEKHKTTDIYPTYAKGLINVNDGLVWVINNGFLNHIKHVHQLQNLYFALTGRELTLNETI